MKLITHIDRITYIDNLSIQFLKEKEFGYEDAIGQKTNSFHVHPFIEIFTCKTIPYQVRTMTETITVGKNDVLIIPPNTPHYRIQTLSELTDGICFGVIIQEHSNEYCENLFSKLLIFNENNNVYFKKQHSEFYDTAKNFLNKITEANIYSPKIKLIYKLCEIAEFFESNDHYHTPIIKSDEKHIETIINFEYILNNQYMQQLSVTRIAEQLFISERQLYRILKNHYNKPLHALLIEKRVNIAKQLLQNSDISIEDICYIVGFQNKVSFYREFKKAFGTTPFNLKKSIKNNGQK